MMKVLIKRVRAFNSATVSLVNSRGSIVSTAKPLAVKFPARYAGSFEEGSVWEIKGKARRRSYRIDNRTITEDFIETTHAVRVCPEGIVISYWIERNIPSVGSLTALKLTRVIRDLNQVIIEGDINTLCSVDGMSADKAQELISRWPNERFYSAMRFLADCGLPAKLAEPITKIYKARAEELVKTDPYLLVPLGVPFEDIERLILKLGLKVSNTDRAVALAEEAAHRKSMGGSTVVLSSDIKDIALDMGYNVSDSAAAEAVSRGALIQVNGGYQTIGMARMEAIVGYRIIEFASRKAGDGASSAAWEKDITEASITAILDKYEQEELGFKLTEKQRQAVTGALLSPVCCINGGAGAGKSTTLKVILGVYKGFRTHGIVTHLTALSGRAAQRMSQSTSYQAKTIAQFAHDKIRTTKSKPPSMEDHELVVIDEASMLDLHIMYRLISLLPNATRLLFVGDTAQLPPIGPGLVFHELVKSSIPTYDLTSVKRQTAYSGIHKFSTTVRKGGRAKLPKLKERLEDSPDFSHSNEVDLELIRSLWDEAGGAKKCIILAPTNSGKFGVDNINAYIQDFIGADRPMLRYRDVSSTLIPWCIKGRYLHLGDHVMVTANDYQNKIRNGDLATLTEVYREPTEHGIYGMMELDGDLIPINDEVIEKLDLGYAITIHKSQGSRWPVGIMVLSHEAENMTDRSLLYTGATRTQERLVILGPETLIRKAIEKGNFSDTRSVAIQEILCQPREPQ